MEVAVIGIKYCNETAELIKNNCSGTHVSEYDLNLGEYPQKHNDVYIITDRLCEGIKIKPDTYMCALDYLVKNIGQDDVAIINADDDNLLRHLDGLICNVITYGYNLRSSVTISGLDEDIFTGQVSYVCSLQRSITTINRKILEPCEIKLSVYNGLSAHTMMAYSSFLLYLDIFN